MFVQPSSMATGVARSSTQGMIFSQLPNTGDIGVVVLDESVALDEYAVLPKKVFLTHWLQSGERKT